MSGKEKAEMRQSATVMYLSERRSKGRTLKQTEYVDLLVRAMSIRTAGTSTWQPIETATDQMDAPWDGKPVLIYTNMTFGSDADRTHRARWTDAVHGSGIFGWAVEDMKFGPYALRGHTLVTHWQALPAPPAKTEPRP